MNSLAKRWTANGAIFTYKRVPQTMRDYINCTKKYGQRKPETKKIRPNLKSNLPTIGKVRKGPGAKLYISISVIVISPLYKPYAKPSNKAEKRRK